MSKEVGFGVFEQGEFGVVDIERDARVDDGVADLDDLAVGASFGVCWAGGIEVRLAESGSHVGGPVPERFEPGGEPVARLSCRYWWVRRTAGGLAKPEQRSRNMSKTSGS